MIHLADLHSEAVQPPPVAEPTEAGRALPWEPQHLIDAKGIDLRGNRVVSLLGQPIGAAGLSHWD